MRPSQVAPFKTRRRRYIDKNFQKGDATLEMSHWRETDHFKAFVSFKWLMCITVILLTSFPLNCTPYRHSRTCAPLTSLLSAAEAPQPLVCAIRAWSRPAGRQATRTPPACASALRRPEALVLPRAGSPAMPARRRKPQAMALFGAVQRRAGLLDFKQPLQPPRRGHSADILVLERVAT